MFKRQFLIANQNRPKAKYSRICKVDNAQTKTISQAHNKRFLQQFSATNVGFFNKKKNEENRYSTPMNQRKMEENKENT